MKNPILFLKLWSFFFLMIMNFVSMAQSAQVEAMLGNKNYHFQNSLISNFKGSKFGFFNTSSLYFYYDCNRKTEIMSQSYLTYKARPWLKITAGTFFASGPGFKTSIAVQLSKKYKDFFVLIVPRMDLWKDPNIEIMTFAEYRPAITEKLRLYSRVQFMRNQNSSHHNRSYENFRVGLHTGNVQIGFAFNKDYYGSERVAATNVGVFVRHEFN